MRFAVEDIPQASLATDGHGRILAANRSLSGFLGHDEVALVGGCFNELLTPASRIFLQTHLWPMLRRLETVNEAFIRLVDRDGQRRSVYFSARQFNDGEDARVLWVFFLGSEREHFETALLAARRRAEQETVRLQEAHSRLRALHIQLENRAASAAEQARVFEDLAARDPLTGLGNRRSLQAAAAHLESLPGLDRGFSVLMMDLDHFKRLNDQHGHDCGDRALVDVAACLATVARRSDFAIRYGGEEFVLILDNIDSAQALRVAERLRKEIAAARPGGQALTVSIGAATADDRFDDLFKVLKDADDALYEAKRRGRNRCVHHLSLRASDQKPEQKPGQA